MFKKFKTAVTFIIIASFLAIACSIFGALAMVLNEGFNAFIDDILLTSGGQLPQLTDEILLFMRLFFIIVSLLTIIVFIPTLVIAFICCKDNKLSRVLFKKKMGLHIALVILCFVSNSVSNIALESYFPIESIASLLDLSRVISSCFYVASIILILTTIIPNAVVVNKINKATVVNSDSENVIVNDEVINKESSEVVNEEVVNEEKVSVDLEEIYTLLAKLERSYKNGEVSLEDYLRMKETLMKKVEK